MRTLSPLVAFAYGVLAMGYVAVALSLIRLWRASRDRLFAYFIVAFALLAAERVAAVLTLSVLEDVTWLYLLRLSAFVLIVAAIVDKNRRG